MKLVVNKCYGGYGLSPKALLALHKLGSRAVIAQTPLEFYGKDWEKELEIDKETNESVNGYITISEDGLIISDESRYSTELRSLPELIQIVEQLGDEANGSSAKLKVIEIPDGIEIEIEYYDGMEIVCEKHRRW
jgi:hypothetical protein